MSGDYSNAHGCWVSSGTVIGRIISTFGLFRNKMVRFQSANAYPASGSSRIIAPMNATLMMPLWRHRFLGLLLAGVLLCTSGIDAGHGHSNVADLDCPVCQLSSVGSAATNSVSPQPRPALSPFIPHPVTVSLLRRRGASYESRGPPLLS